jgi:hypothetical protein
VKSKGWDVIDALAHIVFHSFCEKFRPVTQGHRQAACSKNRRRTLYLANQLFRVRFLRLRTILSTKNVHKGKAGEQL